MKEKKKGNDHSHMSKEKNKYDNFTNKAFYSLETSLQQLAFVTLSQFILHKRKL